MSPSYKFEDKTALDNYRPISGLPVFSKVLERIVYNRFSTTSRKTNFLMIPSMDFVNSDQPSTPWQSSWTTLEGQVFLDLHSEPHTSPHQTNDAEVMWVSSYLFARTQVVNFEETLSEENYITHGVPQGSILVGSILVGVPQGSIHDVGTDLSQCKIDLSQYFSDTNASIIEITLNEEVKLNIQKEKIDFVWF